MFVDRIALGHRWLSLFQNLTSRYMPVDFGHSRSRLLNSADQIFPENVKLTKISSHEIYEELEYYKGFLKMMERDTKSQYPCEERGVGTSGRAKPTERTPPEDPPKKNDYKNDKQPPENIEEFETCDITSGEFQKALGYIMRASQRVC